MNANLVNSNLLDYSPSTPEPVYRRKRPNRITIPDRKKKCNFCYYNFLHFNRHIPTSKALFFSFMFIYTSVYLTSETLQSSSLISSSSHSNNTAVSFAYDLLFTWLITYVLTNQQLISRVNTSKTSNTLLYFIMSHLGAIIFALCGELPMFKHFAISGDFWKHLNPPEAIMLSIVLLTIFGIAIKEYCDLTHNKSQFRRNILNLVLVSGGYFFILYLLIHGGAEGIHYHVHHAIFSGVLSMWFTLWKNPTELIMHGILMGICIEGINFYQLQEFYLFLTKTTPQMTFTSALSINIVYLLISLCIGVCSMF
tara:strand:+ start:5351 stop:6280 length:930 start_codon:yes stop_codon:yes gene_type:complete